jgi:ribose 5-phosphate isomerase B
MKIYFAADHAGFEMKNALLAYVRDELGYEVEDCGAYVLNNDDDYPDFIAIAAQKLSDDAKVGMESRAIVLGASGQGEAMAANRFDDVRCAVFYGEPRGMQTDAAGKELDMLTSTRLHNDANALSLGARFLPLEAAKAAVGLWLEIAFEGEARHVRRVQKLSKLG